MGTMQKPTVSIIQWDPAGEKRHKAAEKQVFYSVKGRFNKNSPCSQNICAGKSKRVQRTATEREPTKK